MKSILREILIGIVCLIALPFGVIWLIFVLILSGLNRFMTTHFKQCAGSRKPVQYYNGGKL